MSSDPSTNNILSDSSTKNTPSPISKRLVAQVLYEATLQDLLRARNYAAFQLLQECNDLVDQRGQLTGEYIAYNHMDFFKPPKPLLPYITTPNGEVLQLRVSRPKGAHYPKDRHQFDVGVQTIGSEASDETLVNIDTNEIQDQEDHKHCRTESSAEESPAKHRKL